MSQERADATLQLVADAGINHIDTARGYGESEVRLAPWLAEHRSEVFLATKARDRTADGVRRELEDSLTRLGLDHVDLIQMHNLVEPEEFEIAHGPGGAVEGLMAARDEGLVSHVGVTGHGIRIAGMHLQSLERADLASVLYPFNFTLMDNPVYRADVDALRTLCAERGIAQQTIKAVAKGRWPEPAMRKFSWYEPISDPAAIALCVRHVLANDDLYLNTTSDARLLPAIFDAAQGTPTAPSDDEMRAITADEGVTPLFDGGALERI